MSEVVAFEQQWLIQRLRERVGETFAKIELSRMPAPSAEVTVCFTGDSCLVLRHRLDYDSGYLDELVELTTGNRVATSVNDKRRFEKVCRGHTADTRALDQRSKLRRFGLGAGDCNNRRRGEDRRGNPRSSWSKSPWSTDRNVRENGGNWQAFRRVQAYMVVVEGDEVILYFD